MPGWTEFAAFGPRNRAMLAGRHHVGVPRLSASGYHGRVALFTRFLPRAMHPRYRIADTSNILSPALLIFREVLEENLKTMIAVAGGPERLRPHCKTHKMPRVVELELAAGI